MNIEPNRLLRKAEDNIVRLRAAYPEGLHFVVGDTHGETAALRTLIEQITFDPTKDHVYFVGDYNAGGHARALLKYMEQYYEPDCRRPGFHMIRGNHEREMEPSYPLENLPDFLVLRGRQMNYYIVHAGMLTAAFDAINADMARHPGQTVFAYRLDDACAGEEGALRQLIWSRHGLYSQHTNGKLWPTEENLHANRACILHGHTPYCFFCGRSDYGARNLFWPKAHIWFSEDLQAFDLDSNIKGRYKNGETYRGLTALCLEVCGEIAAACGGRLTAEGFRNAQNAVFSAPVLWTEAREESGEPERILRAAPDMKTIRHGQDGNIYID